MKKRKLCIYCGEKPRKKGLYCSEDCHNKELEHQRRERTQMFEELKINKKI